MRLLVHSLASVVPSLPTIPIYLDIWYFTPFPTTVSYRSNIQGGKRNYPIVPYINISKKFYYYLHINYTISNSQIANKNGIDLYMFAEKINKNLLYRI